MSTVGRCGKSAGTQRWLLRLIADAGGDDFNGTLLRVASVTAFGLALAAAVLGVGRCVVASAQCAGPPVD